MYHKGLAWLDELWKLYMNGMVIQKILAKWKKILGKICFSEQTFYRKQSLDALPELWKTTIGPTAAQFLYISLPLFRKHVMKEGIWKFISFVRISGRRFSPSENIRNDKCPNRRIIPFVASVPFWFLAGKYALENSSIVCRVPL